MNMKYLSHRPIRRRHVDIRQETRLILQTFPDWQDWLESTYSPLKDQEIYILIFFSESEPGANITLPFSDQRTIIKLKRALRKMQFFRFKYELWRQYVDNDIELPLYNEEILDTPVQELDLSKKLLNLIRRYKWQTLREAVVFSSNDLRAKGFTKYQIEELEEILRPEYDRPSRSEIFIHPFCNEIAEDIL